MYLFIQFWSTLLQNNYQSPSRFIYKRYDQTWHSNSDLYSCLPFIISQLLFISFNHPHPNVHFSLASHWLTQVRV